MMVCRGLCTGKMSLLPHALDKVLCLTWHMTLAGLCRSANCPLSDVVGGKMSKAACQFATGLNDPGQMG